jgi:hypothetical protein
LQSACNPEAKWPAIPLYSGIHGWMFYAQEEYDENLPAEIIALMNKARELGADWVDLDSDGDVLDGLPTWEW